MPARDLEPRQQRIRRDAGPEDEYAVHGVVCSVGTERGDALTSAYLAAPGALCVEVLHLAADAAQVFGLLGRVGREPDDGHALATVEHAVAGGAVAHAAAEVLGLTGIGLGPGQAARYDEGAALHEVGADAHAEYAAHVSSSQGAAAREFDAGRLCVPGKGLDQLRAGGGREAGVVVHKLRAVERRILHRGAYYQRGLAALPRCQRRRHPRGAGADYQYVENFVQVYASFA